MDSPVNFNWNDLVISMSDCGRQLGHVNLANMTNYIRTHKIETVNIAGRTVVVKGSWDKHVEKLKAKQASTTA